MSCWKMGLCSGWGGAAALFVALLVLPAPLVLRQEEPAQAEVPPPSTLEELLYMSHIDVILMSLMLGCPAMIYIYDWVLRKALERRVNKLNKVLSESLDRLRVMDEKDRQMDATLRLLREATAEYNLLLYLLLERRRALPTPRRDRTFDKELRDNFAYLRNSLEL